MAYTSYGLDGFSEDFKTHRTLEAYIGVVGPLAAAGKIQNKIHEWFGKDQVNGWAHQLFTEPGAMVSYTERRRLIALPKTLGDLDVHAAGALGNIFTHADVGVTGRFGYNVVGLGVSDRPIVVEISPPPSPPEPAKPTVHGPQDIGSILRKYLLPLRGAYAFARFDGRAAYPPSRW